MVCCWAFHDFPLIVQNALEIMEVTGTVEGAVVDDVPPPLPFLCVMPLAPHAKSTHPRYAPKLPTHASTLLCEFGIESNSLCNAIASLLAVDFEMGTTARKMPRLPEEFIQN